MKRPIFHFSCALAAWAFLAAPVMAAPALSRRVAGRFIVLSDQNQHGQAWYVHPPNGERYFLHDPQSCFEVAANLALGIKNADLVKLATPAARRRNAALVSRLRGKILLAVEQHGALLYFNPRDLLRYPIRDGAACLALARRFSDKLTTKELRGIPMNDAQLVFDFTFDQAATAKIVNGKPVSGPHAEKILPIASLTKLMTALVLLDYPIDWEQKITVTAEDLAYPKAFVEPGDVTSEVPFQAGDRVTVRDLWRAMLVASSNQAAGMLSIHSGLPAPVFASAMNAKARSLGLEKTAFTDPSGLDVGNVSTAVEMAKIAAAAFGRPEISGTSVMGAFTIVAERPDGTQREIAVVNRNYSLLQFGVDGAKTGFLNEAQRTVAAKKGDVIAVVLHARSMRERNDWLTTLLQDP